MRGGHQCLPGPLSLSLNRALSMLWGPISPTHTPSWGEAGAACVPQIPLPQHTLSSKCTGKVIQVMDENRNYDLEYKINLLSKCVLGPGPMAALFLIAARF